jgi:hypothetical protein
MPSPKGDEDGDPWTLTKEWESCVNGSGDSQLLRLICPRFACRERSKPVLKMVQSKAIYISRLSLTLIGCLSVLGGERIPTVSTISFERISSSVCMQGKVKTCLAGLSALLHKEKCILMYSGVLRVV